MILHLFQKYFLHTLRRQREKNIRTATGIKEMRMLKELQKGGVRLGGSEGHQEKELDYQSEVRLQKIVCTLRRINGFCISERGKKNIFTAITPNSWMLYASHWWAVCVPAQNCPSHRHIVCIRLNRASRGNQSPPLGLLRSHIKTCAHLGRVKEETPIRGAITDSFLEEHQVFDRSPNPLRFCPTIMYSWQVLITDCAGTMLNSSLASGLHLCKNELRWLVFKPLSQ